MSLAFLSNHTLVVDTSVLIAIVLEEAGYETFLPVLEWAPKLYISSATYVELFVVAFRRLTPKQITEVDALLQELAVEVVPFTREEAILAREAFQRFGKGRHPAALNFGDCFSYALAKHLDEPLLFKGEDFSRADVLAA